GTGSGARADAHVSSTCTRPAADSRTTSAALRTLGAPGARVVVVVDDGVLSRLEDEVEVPAMDGLVGPPAVDDAPLLADDADALPVDAARGARGVPLAHR